jgi:hypothetical protein
MALSFTSNWVIPLPAQGDNGAVELTLYNGAWATFDTALTTALGLKAPLASPVFSGTVESGGGFKFDKQAYQSSLVTNGNSSTSKTIDWTQGVIQSIVTTGSCTLTFTPPTGPAVLTLKIIHEASSSAYTYTWPSVKWPSATAPSTTNTSGAVDIVSLFFDGTYYYGLFGLNFS